MTAWWPFGAKAFLEPEDETWQVEPAGTLRPLLKGHLYADLARAYKSLTGRPSLLAGLG